MNIFLAHTQLQEPREFFFFNILNAKYYVLKRE